jgi:hypothetical protein
VSSGGDAGIAIQSAPHFEIERCSVHDAPAVAAAIVVEALYQPSVTGFITDSFVANVPAGGIRIDRIATGAVRNNVIEGWSTATAGPGLSIQGATGTGVGVLIEGNTLRGANGSAEGIVLDADAHRTAVRTNVVSGAIQSGIVVRSNGNFLVGNVVGVTGLRGILVEGSDNRLEANQVSAASGNGVTFQFGFNNLLENNTLEGNGGFGVSFTGSTNAYRGNMLRGNGSPVGGFATDAGGNIQ